MNGDDGNEEEVVLISSWSDLLMFAKGEIESLRDLCAQRDDVYLSRVCERALGGKSEKKVDEKSSSGKAIVDIAVSNTYRLPPGFEKIETSMSGSEANLNEGMNAKSLFLSVYRQGNKDRSKLQRKNSFSTPLKMNIRSSSSSDGDTILLRRDSMDKFGFHCKGTEVVKLSMSCHAAGLRIGHRIQSVDGEPVQSQKDIVQAFERLDDSNKQEVKVRVSVHDLSSLAMRPITRLIPVFTCDGGFIPPGWFPVCHFPTGKLCLSPRAKS